MRVQHGRRHAGVPAEPVCEEDGGVGRAQQRPRAPLVGGELAEHLGGVRRRLLPVHLRAVRGGREADAAVAQGDVEAEEKLADLDQRRT